MKKIYITENQLKNLMIEMTNPNGIVAYHGSKSEISSFVTDFVGGKDADDHEGPGIYFSTDEEDAGHYGQNIYKVTLNPRKLLSDQTKKGISVSDATKLIKMARHWKEDAMNWDENPIRGLNVSLRSIFEETNAKDIITQIYIEYYQSYPKDFVDNAAKLGFDGIMVHKDWGATHIIVYNPNIIELTR